MAFSQLLQSERLLVGYSVDVEIVYDVYQNVLCIPISALMEGKYVLVYCNGVLEDRKVGIGLTNWEYIEVIVGLSDGDQVVLLFDRVFIVTGKQIGRAHV